MEQRRYGQMLDAAEDSADTCMRRLCSPDKPMQVTRHDARAKKQQAAS